MRLVSNSHLYWEKAQNQVGSKILGKKNIFFSAPTLATKLIMTGPYRAEKLSIFSSIFHHRLIFIHFGNTAATSSACWVALTEVHLQIYMNHLTCLRSSGQSGCCEGCAALNASSCIKVSLILDMTGNCDISTLNLSEKNAIKLTKTDLAYMSETTKWTRFTITVRSVSH